MPCSPYRQTVTESGGTELGVGAVADGEFLKRVGSEVVGATAGGVSTFNGRTGTVVPQTGDYTEAQISDKTERVYLMVGSTNDGQYGTADPDPATPGVPVVATDMRGVAFAQSFSFGSNTGWRWMLEVPSNIDLLRTSTVYVDFDDAGTGTGGLFFDLRLAIENMPLGPGGTPTGILLPWGASAAPTDTMNTRQRRTFSSLPTPAAGEIYLSVRRMSASNPDSPSSMRLRSAIVEWPIT